MEYINVENSWIAIQTEIVHSWPYIPGIQWNQVYGLISNTVISTFLFLILIVIFSLLAKKVIKNKWGKLKIFFLSSIDFFYKYLKDSFWDKQVARRYFPFIIGVFLIILLGNLFWLIIKWLWKLTTTGVWSYFSEFLRPIHSDLNTTLVLGLGTIIFSLFISFKYTWVFKTTKWYLFNFSWKTLIEKFVNVFVWWLHFLALPSWAISLSLRLFGNIFAWMVLISVIGYLGFLMTANLMEVWRFLTIPFWIFEIFVAFIQAVVFAWLMIAYFKQSLNKTH